MARQIHNIREHIAWSYANLARADAALRDGATSYKKVHHIIRNKLFSGLLNGSMSMRSLYDDERLKMTLPQACCYCGSQQNLSVDHLMPRIRKGTDHADNLVLACRSCNSSKQGKDLLEWMNSFQKFPSVLLLRRYLKLAAKYCEKHSLMDCELNDSRVTELPFSLKLLPHKFPPLTELSLWIHPILEGKKPESESPMD